MEINIVDKDNNLVAHLKIDFENKTIDDVILHKDYEIAEEGTIINI